MIKFSEYIKKKNKKRMGVVPMPIHFKHVGTSINEDWFEKNDNTHLERRETFRQQLGNISVTPEQKKAIQSYTGFDSGKINRELIKKSTSKHPTVTHLDNLIKNNPLTKKLHSYSAVGFDPSEHLNEKKQMLSPAYISSTPNKNIAFSFTKKLKDGIHHIVHFHLNENDPATHIAKHSANPNEEETLISRNVTLQHHGTHDFEDGGKKYRVHKMSIVR